MHSIRHVDINTYKLIYLKISEGLGCEKFYGIIKFLYYLESTAIIVGYASALIFGKSTKLKSK